MPGIPFQVRLAGVLRLTHPFPSLLDGAAVAAVAIVAGASLLEAFRAGAAMVALQATIGALNDIVDAPADALKPGKPLPRGVVSLAAARIAGLACAGLGLALSAAGGSGLLVVGAATLAVGATYDLRLKGTPWSWLPFAAGIPLLPVYGWLASGRPLPAAFLVLLPVAVVAGGALAVANALVDVERDVAAGHASIATRLGRVAAWRVHAVAQLLVIAAAAATLAGEGRGLGPTVGAAAGAGLVLVGVVLVGHDDPQRRERGWEVEAVGVAVMAAAWLAAATPTP